MTEKSEQQKAAPISHFFINRGKKTRKKHLNGKNLRKYGIIFSKAYCKKIFIMLK